MPRAAQRTAARWIRNRRGPPWVRGVHIQPATLASANGKSSSHSTREPLREVNPPHEYASTCRPCTSEVR